MEIKLGSAVVAVSVGIERAPLRNSAKVRTSMATPQPSTDLAAERQSRLWLAQEELRRERRQAAALGWWNGLYGRGR